MDQIDAETIPLDGRQIHNPLETCPTLFQIGHEGRRKVYSTDIALEELYLVRGSI
jgi:hypothetical protein